MKANLVFAAAATALSIASTSFAQDQLTATAQAAATPDAAADEPKTLIGTHGLVKHQGWYLAPAFGTTAVDGHAAYDAGIRGAWILDHTVGVGLAGYGFGWGGPTADNRALSTDRRLSGGYGGFFAQYAIMPDEILHGLVETTVGGGYLCTNVAPNGDGDCAGGRSFFVAEPVASLEVNMTKFMRVAFGVGYRFAVAPERDGISGAQMGGLVARTAFEFGQF